MSQRVSDTSNQSNATGFTIVELLIVIIVIAVLATVTIVAYNAIQQRAQASAAQATIAGVTQKLAAYMVDNSAYPANLDGIGINSAGVGLQYTVDNATTPPTYCVTAVSGSTSYKADSASTQPVSGGCIGHVTPSGTVVTNMVPNPSVELAITGYGGPNSSVVTRDATRAYSGSYSALTTMPIGNTPLVGVSVWSIGASAVPTVLKANTTYNFSAWVYVPATTVNMRLSTQGAGIASGTTTTSSVKDAWTRLSGAFTTSTSGSIILYVLNAAATSSAGTQAWVDAVQVTESATAYTYGDGSTAGWAWNATAHNSTSYGPAN